MTTLLKRLALLPKSSKFKRVRTPTVLQMEAVECGAASLAMVLAYHGRIAPLEEVRLACGVSRDGTKASNLVKAARRYGLQAKGFSLEPHHLPDLPLPLIAFWNFNHFLVVEGFGRDKVYLNDPAAGKRIVSQEEFDQSFTGVTLVFEPGPDFVRSGQRRSLRAALQPRLAGLNNALLFVLLAGLALVVPGFVTPTLIRVFVDDYLMRGNASWAWALVWGLALAALFTALVTWIQQTALLRLESRLTLSGSSTFFWHILRLPYEFFTQRFGGEVGARVAINDQVANLLSERLASTLINLVVIIFLGALMFWYSPLLACVSLGCAGLNLLALRYISEQRVNANQKLLQESGKLLGAAMSGLQMIETLKATGAETDFFARWAGYRAKAENVRQELIVATELLNAVPTLLTALNAALILSLGAWQVMNGTLTLGLLVAFQSLAISFLAPVNSLVLLGSTLQEMHGNLDRLDDVLRYPTDPINQIEGRPLSSAAPARLSGYIELRHITFGYSRVEAPLINDFSLRLNPGARVALVGGSGSGKSTIARLVVGLFQPWEGDLLFDGLPVRGWPRGVLQNSLTYVSQEISLFEGTVRDNLTLWDRTVPEADLIQAARDACIHDDIALRPGGYDSAVEEGGRNFSGGQRQRLEIARALINTPTVLVLDEATSALDAVTEQRIDDALRRRGCTCLIIAHRLSTIRDCDEIIVLDQGRVVQRGPHETLMQAEGLYARLIAAE